jgi:hypothetical protein
MKRRPEKQPKQTTRQCPDDDYLAARRDELAEWYIATELAEREAEDALPRRYRPGEGVEEVLGD